MIALAAALLLLATTVAVWFVAAGARAAARVQIRFAGVLFAALAAAALTAPMAAATVTLLVLPLALAVLALAGTAGFGKPVPPAVAAIVLGAVCLAGLGSAITGERTLSFVPVAAALLVLAVTFARQFDAARLASLQGMLSVLCLLGAAASFASEGAGRALLLFCAAGLLGLTLALSRSDLVVEERALRDLRGRTAIRGR